MREMEVGVESDKRDRWWDKWNIEITGLVLIVAAVIGFSRLGWTRTSALALTIAGIILVPLAVDLVRRLEARRHRRDPSARIHSSRFWTVAEVGTFVLMVVLSLVIWAVTYGELPMRVWLRMTVLIMAVVGVTIYVMRRTAATPPAAPDGTDPHGTDIHQDR
jgi:hypothetical protein